MRRHFMAELIPWAYFSDEGVIRLRGGGTMIGYNIRGPGHETTSEQDVLAACERLAASFSHFVTGDFIHLICHRVPATEYPQRSFSNRAAYLVDRERAEQFKAARYFRTLTRLYISNQDESAIANQLKALFFASTAHRMRSSRALQMQRFFHRIEKWEDVIATILRPRRMNTPEMFRDLILAVNGIDYEAVPPRPGAPLHQIIGQQDLIGGSTPRIGQLHIRPVTLVYPWPKETVEQSLAVLLTHPGELMLSCRFVCLDQVDAGHVLRLDRKHFIREANGTGLKQWFVNAFNMNKRASANQDVEEQITEIDYALSDLAKGVPYGWATITALVRGPDEEEVNSRARQLVKDLAEIQHGARIEDAAAVRAIIGALPGQGTANKRRPIISAPNLSDLSMPIEHWEGTPTIDSTFFPKGTKVSILITGSGAEPFHLPSHIRSVGHELIIGPTTGGKSTLLGTKVAALSALADVRIVWLDRDYSSFVLTHAMGGEYIELATDSSSPLCPFQSLDADNGTAWLFDWFTRLYARWQIDINERQAADLAKAIELAKLSDVRTMTGFMHLIHDPATRGVLRNYVAGGQWGHIFDAEPTTTERSLLTTYEMRRLDALGERASGPATELIIRDAEIGLGANPTFVVIDEAKWILSSRISLPWVDRALRTFRKYNAAIILATQSLAEIESTEVRSLLLESTAIKIFLPNRMAAGEHVRQLYTHLGLREKEIDIIAAAVPQRDYLCTTEYGTRLFRLDLGPTGRALCASTGADSVARARQILAEVGPEHFLDGWLHASGLGPALVAQPKATPPMNELMFSNGKVHANA
jgi:type IV secretion system protein TrbE